MTIYLSCWAMAPDGPHGFADLVNELHPAELELFVARLDDREAKGRQPADPEAGRAQLLALIAERGGAAGGGAGAAPGAGRGSRSGAAVIRRQRVGRAAAAVSARVQPDAVADPRGAGASAAGARQARAEPADAPAVIVPPPAAASTPEDTATPPVPEDRMPAIDEPAVLDDEPAVLDDEPAVLDDESANVSSAPSAGPAEEWSAPAEIAAPVESAGTASVAKLPGFPGKTAVEGQNSHNEPGRGGRDSRVHREGR